MSIPNYSPKTARPFYILLGILTFVAFLPCLDNGFTNWDDPAYLLKNPYIRDLSPAGIWRIFTAIQDLYRPLVNLSFALEYHVFGLQPFIYHLTNVVLHVLNVWLVFRIAGRFLPSRWAAFAGALWFAVHPLRVESVAWITERKDMLYALFFFLALDAFIRFRRSGDRRSYTSCFLFFVLSVLSKPMAVTLPVSMVVLDRTYFGRSWKEALGGKWIFWGLSAAFSAFTLFTQYGSGSMKEGSKLFFWERCLVAAHALPFYLQKTLMPVGLSNLYPYPYKGEGAALPAAYFWAPLFAVTLVVVWIRLARISREVGFAGIFFLVNIFPVLQLVPSGPAVAADRYTYVASLGLVVLFGHLVHTVWTVRFAASRVLRILLLVVLMLFFPVLGLLTWNRTFVWENTVVLWTDAIAKDPETATAYLNRGTEYVFQKRYDLALADYNELIRRRPDHPSGYNNSGYYHSLLGKIDEAIADFTKAVELDPKFAEAYSNRGCEYGKKLEIEKAFADFDRAVRLDPRFAEGYNNRGNAYNSLGQFEKALKDYTSAIRFKPDYASAYNNRGNVLSQLKRFEEALSDYAQAERLNPTFADVYNNRGYCYTLMGRYPEAVKDFMTAVRLRPDYALARENLKLVQSLVGMTPHNSGQAGHDQN